MSVLVVGILLVFAIVLFVYYLVTHDGDWDDFIIFVLLEYFFELIVELLTGWDD